MADANQLAELCEFCWAGDEDSARRVFYCFEEVAKGKYERIRACLTMKTILRREFRATLNFRKFKVAHNPLRSNDFFKLCQKLHLIMLITI